MRKVKQVNIKNCIYYVYNNQINLKDFDGRPLKVDKKNYIYFLQIDIYFIGYVTVKKIANCNNIDIVNPLNLMINEMIGHFQEKNGSKYLVLDDVDEKKKFQRNMKKFWTELKKILKQLMVVKESNMGKVYKNKFESNDDLPINKPIKLRLLTIIIRCVFSEGDKFYSQLFLDDALCELV